MPLVGNERFAYWDMSLINWTGVAAKFNYMRSFISSISVEYSVNDISKMIIDVTSINFLEDFMQKGQKVKVDMGWSPQSLVTMLEGVIDVNPEGSSSDFMSYSVSAVDKAYTMTREEKVRNFPNLIKRNIVSIIIGGSGYTPYVSISDNTPINIGEMPMQSGKTDLEFLEMCANKWGCLMWIDSQKTPKTIYFVDAAKAHGIGDLFGALRTKKPLSDLFGKYSLGYKTDYAKNNVAKISWKFGNSPSGENGSLAVKRTGETSPKVTKAGDYVFDFGDLGVYKMNPAIKKDKALNAEFVKKFSTIAPNASELNTSFWIRVDEGGGESKTNKNLQENAGHAKKGIVLDIDLNKGDPYLRPPRKATLYCGSNDPRAVTGNLPKWLIQDGVKGTEININKVRTQIVDGMIKTSLQATL